MTNIHDIQAKQLLDNCRGQELSTAISSAIWERVTDSALALTDAEFTAAGDLGFGDDVMVVRAIHQLTAAVMELTQVIAMKA